ncbi:MAG TPA: MFS transporter, partial [Corynebacterium variabile]|nr:MFS transporter [Corynebacterium variabile]
MATYNLGVGAAVAVGPLLVAVFLPLVGPTGLTVIMIGLYFVSAWMSTRLKGTQPGFDGVPVRVAHASESTSASEPSSAPDKENIQ